MNVQAQMAWLKERRVAYARLNKALAKCLPFAARRFAEAHDNIILSVLGKK